MKCLLFIVTVIFLLLRYKQEVEAAKTVETNIKSSSKSKPMSVRDMVAASSTQPSSESKLKTRDTQHVLPFSMASLKLCIAAPVPRLGGFLYCS